MRLMDIIHMLIPIWERDILTTEVMFGLASRVMPILMVHAKGGCHVVR